MEDLEGIYNQLIEIRDITKMLSFLNGEGVQYSQEEVANVFRSIYEKLVPVLEDMEDIVYPGE